MGQKQRLDQLLVTRRHVLTRSRAADLIRRGAVQVGGQIVTKPGKLTAFDAVLDVNTRAQPYVSRGGLKLAAALDHFSIDVTDMIALDIGASTGGFTDVLLRRGAARVFALDAGHGQLHERLKSNPKVTSLERLNVKHLGRTHIPDSIDIAVCDVSFISLKKALPPGLNFCRPGAWLAALIKPQFEVGPENVGKGGIVRDTALQAMVCNDIRRWLEDDMGWCVSDLIPSPIQGADGNVEFLIAARARMD